MGKRTGSGIHCIRVSKLYYLLTCSNYGIVNALSSVLRSGGGQKTADTAMSGGTPLRWKWPAVRREVRPADGRWSNEREDGRSLPTRQLEPRTPVKSGLWAFTSVVICTSTRRLARPLTTGMHGRILMRHRTFFVKHQCEIHLHSSIRIL